MFQQHLHVGQVAHEGRQERIINERSHSPAGKLPFYRVFVTDGDFESSTVLILSYVKVRMSYLREKNPIVTFTSSHLRYHGWGNPTLLRVSDPDASPNFHGSRGVYYSSENLRMILRRCCEGLPLKILPVESVNTVLQICALRNVSYWR